MRLTIFSKSLRSKEGKPFKVYISRLKKRSGEEVSCRVNFREGVAVPSTTPIIVEVAREDAHLSTKRYTDEAGEVRENLILWVNAYTPTGETYVDHSLDDFE